jgi:hypothetical protein
VALPKRFPIKVVALNVLVLGLKLNAVAALFTEAV